MAFSGTNPTTPTSLITWNSKSSSAAPSRLKSNYECCTLHVCSVCVASKIQFFSYSSCLLAGYSVCLTVSLISYRCFGNFMPPSVVDFFRRPTKSINKGWDVRGFEVYSRKFFFPVISSIFFGGFHFPPIMYQLLPAALLPHPDRRRFSYEESSAVTSARNVWGELVKLGLVGSFRGRVLTILKKFSGITLSEGKIFRWL